MIFLFTLVEADKRTKAVPTVEFVTCSLNLACLPVLISPYIPNLGTFEQQAFV